MPSVGGDVGEQFVIGYSADAVERRGGRGSSVAEPLWLTEKGFQARSVSCIGSNHIISEKSLQIAKTPVMLIDYV